MSDGVGDVRAILWLAGTLGTQGLEWVYGHHVALGAPRSVGGHFGACQGVGVSRVYWGLAGTLGTHGPEGV